MAKGWKLHLYLLVIGLGVETDVIVLVGVDDSSNDGCSCIGLVALLDGTTVTLFLARFLFGGCRWWCIRFINIFIASFFHVPKLFTPFASCGSLCSATFCN